MTLSALGQHSAHQSHQPHQQEKNLSKRSSPYLLLPEGSLYLSRVQLEDANKSYQCQYKNVLNSRVSISQLAGRLLVAGE